MGRQHVTGNRQQATGYRLFFACSLWLVACSYCCFAQPISSTELIKNAKEYDGKRVVYQGEVIGDVMVRRYSAWLNLSDGENTVGVWVRKELLPQIEYVGSYLQKGDTLEIEGVFQASCPQHGGDLDIHAEKVKILARGYKIEEKISPLKQRWARNLSLSAALLFACFFIREKRNRWKRRLKI